MKIAFYDTKPYDKIWFKPLAKEHNFDITFFETNSAETLLYLPQATMQFVYLLTMKRTKKSLIYFMKQALKLFFSDVQDMIMWI